MTSLFNLNANLVHELQQDVKSNRFKPVDYLLAPLYRPQ